MAQTPRKTAPPQPWSTVNHKKERTFIPTGVDEKRVHACIGYCKTSVGFSNASVHR